MELIGLERLAAGSSPVHRASVLPKLLAVSLGIAGLTLSQSLPALVVMALGWIAVLVWARLPVLRLLGWASYAAGFALLYLFVTWSGFERALVLLLKAVGAALAMLSLVATTPYAQLFGTLNPLLPCPLSDALLLIYRSFFILIHRWSHLSVALRLRGELSWRYPRQSLAGLSPALGSLLLGALDHSEALYEAMLLRGYRGILARFTGPLFNRWGTLPLLVGGLGLMTLVPAAVLPVGVLFLLLLIAGIGSRTWSL